VKNTKGRKKRTKAEWKQLYALVRYPQWQKLDNLAATTDSSISAIVRAWLDTLPEVAEEVES
jgi:hypothetical protein